MKRSLASLVTFAMTLGIVTPAFAFSNYGDTRNKQPAVYDRVLKSTSVLYYRNRGNRVTVRALYNGLIQAMMPSILAVTGRETSTDTFSVDKRSPRTIGMSAGEERRLHCTEESERCGY